MATEAGQGETPTSTSTNTPAGTETGQQEQQGQQQGTTPETGGQEQQQPSNPEKLPDDHPLVKALAAQKQEIATHKAELAELRAKSSKVTELEEALTKRPTPEALATLQTRNDRLEAFLQAAGGPLGKALDSRTFTRDLFETDKPIKDIVKEWNAANPSATSTALGSSSAAPADKPSDMNTLLRAALKP